MAGQYNHELPPGFLLLADGTVFPGTLFGQLPEAGQGRMGEVCFNTSLAGYQEIITDPSYYSQIVTFTCPMIGNYGINPEDFESDRIYLSAVVCREYVDNYSNWRADRSLSQYLAEQDVPGLAGVDTRELTLHIRKQGAQPGILFSGHASPENTKKAAEQLTSFPGLVGRDLASEVACDKPYKPSAGRPQLGDYPKADPQFSPLFKLAVIDCGVKYNILRNLSKYGFDVEVFPAGTSWEQIKDFQAYFISNGPGDPEPVESVVGLIKNILESKKPLFGICLGHQLIALALGSRTYKMKFGHRGGNQPIMDVATGRVQITSQNHGFAVETGQETGQHGGIATAVQPGSSSTQSGGTGPQESTQGEGAKQQGTAYTLSQMNLNDDTLEGLELPNQYVMAVQYHPEAAPGPHDAEVLFGRFRERCELYYSLSS